MEDSNMLSAFWQKNNKNIGSDIAVGLLLVHTVLMLIDEIPVTCGNVGKMMIMK